jgi:large conductance mechanosensitive channel
LNNKSLLAFYIFKTFSSHLKLFSMAFFKEFKDFAMRGNLVDIAVAFVMGGAFGKVVTTFTEGIIAPIIGLLGGKDLSKYKFTIKPEVKDATGAVTTQAVEVLYGTFLTAIIDFIIVAFVMFLVVKGINSLKKKEEPAVAAPVELSSTDKLLIEIRDALKK